MCQVFISADPTLYDSRARSLRLHGVATSIKLENLFWQVLDIMCRPFIVVARFVAPRQVIDRHVPMVAFLLMVFGWIGVTILKVQTCVKMGVHLCQ